MRYTYLKKVLFSLRYVQRINKIKQAQTDLPCKHILIIIFMTSSTKHTILLNIIWNMFLLHLVLFQNLRTDYKYNYL